MFSKFLLKLYTILKAFIINSNDFNTISNDFTSILNDFNSILNDFT